MNANTPAHGPAPSAALEMRVRALNGAPPGAGARYVLYWMVAARRTTHNFALDRALQWCAETRLPLLVFEPLRLDYPHASPRLHTFIVQGIADNHGACLDAGVTHLPYIEQAAGEGKGLLEALAKDAVAVVTDDYPWFFIPHMLEAAAERLAIPLEAVDSNGLLPLAATEKTHYSAYLFRKHLQGALPSHLMHAPRKNPLEALAEFGRATPPNELPGKWSFPGEAELADAHRLVAGLDVGGVARASPLDGGATAAAAALDRFMEEGLEGYVHLRDHPDLWHTSRLSPYLHFGHISAHAVFETVAHRANWTPAELSLSTSGKREGWWNMDEDAEAFLDQLVTWRELGYNHARLQPGWDRYRTLPEWALNTIARHAGDRREYLYGLEEFENAATHDRLWNAAQKELVRRGTLHNRLRMYWGKMIYAWSPSGEEALASMLTLNDRYALDGRDPNSVSGITWCLGRFDRAWGPERPVFGTLRYMSGKVLRRKFQCELYLDKFAPEP